MLIMHSGREISCFLMTLVRYGSLDKAPSNINLRYGKAFSVVLSHVCVYKETTWKTEYNTKVDLRQTECTSTDRELYPAFSFFGYTS
jgi:hypothetical protein